MGKPMNNQQAKKERERARRVAIEADPGLLWDRHVANGKRLWEPVDHYARPEYGKRRTIVTTD